MTPTRRTILAAIAAVPILAPLGSGAHAQALGVSRADAAAGLTEALTTAARIVTEQLGRRDGFFGNLNVRIPLPNALARTQRALAPIGLSGPLDDLQLRVNRAAEAAMPEARRLLVRTIRGMTWQDALSILSGGDDAATRYLRTRTEADLTAALRPPMQRALEQAGALRALDAAAGRAGLDPAAQNLRGDLIDFSVSRALDAAFRLIAVEERAIRQDPLRRTSPLLRRVFSAVAR